MLLKAFHTYRGKGCRGWLMNKHKQVGNWNFELKQVFARKTKVHGEEFKASAVITITDGEPHIELLINKQSDAFTKLDYREFKAFLAQLGFENVKFARFKNSNKKEVEKTI